MFTQPAPQWLHHLSILLFRCKCLHFVILMPRPHLASSPGPTPKNRERGLVSLANFPVSAASACYATITCLTWSRGSQLLLMRVDEQILLRSDYRQILWGKSSGLASVTTLWVWRFMKSMLASFPFSYGLGTSLLYSGVRNLVIGNGRTWFIYSKRRLLTAHMGIFPSNRPLSRFWVGPGDKARPHPPQCILQFVHHLLSTVISTHKQNKPGGLIILVACGTWNRKLTLCGQFFLYVFFVYLQIHFRNINMSWRVGLQKVLVQS